MNDHTRPSLLDTFLERLSGQEDLELEFKAARANIPRSIWETISAFANTNGGWIILGVSHDEQTSNINIEGVANAPALLQDLRTQLRNRQKISSDVCGPNDAKVEKIGDKDIIVIRVPAAPRSARPIFINDNRDAGTYVRRNSGDFQCTREEVERILREASGVTIDATILEDFSVDDIDQDTLLRYRQQYRLTRPSSPWNTHDDIAFLKNIGAYKRDRHTRKEGLTVAGLLLLGKAGSIQDWRNRHLIDYRLLPEQDDPNERWSDRVTWEGNLFDAFYQIYPRLISGLPTPFKLQGGRRIDESDFDVVLREALVNLLVHTDYKESSSSLILRSPRNYLFRNPGDSRVPDIDLQTGNRSEPRNPVLVRMFRFVGLADEAGTGIPKILQAWRSLGFRLPSIDVGTERYEFTIDLQLAHLLSQNDLNWLQSLNEEWTSEEQMALVLARHEDHVDNQTLRRYTGRHSFDVTKILGGLRDRGFLMMSGVGRTARYQLGPKANISSPSAMQVSSTGNGTSSTDNGTTSTDNGSTSIDNGLITDAEWAQLEELASISQVKKRLDPTTRDRLIIRLCAHKTLSLNELSRLMHRNPNYLREPVQHLVTSGQLELLYPTQPSHPNQRYRSTQALLVLEP